MGKTLPQKVNSPNAGQGPHFIFLKLSVQD